MALNGITLCCLSEKCQRVLNNQDNLQDHINHKIVTSQQIAQSYQNYKKCLKKDLEDGFYVKQLLNLQQRQRDTLNRFVNNAKKEIKDFQQHIIEQTEILLQQLGEINLDDIVEKDIVSNYLDIQKNTFDENEINRLIKLIYNNKTFTERQLKDGQNDLQGIGQGIAINFNIKLQMLKPQQYYNNTYEQVQQKDQTIKYISQQLQQLKIDFYTKMKQWSENVHQVFSSHEQSTLTVVNTQEQKHLRGHSLNKIEVQHVLQDLLIYSQQNYLTVCNVDHLKSSSTLKLNLNVTDFTIDSEKNIIALIQGSDLLLFNILDNKKIRKFTISIDLSKGVGLRFFENQICVSSGVSLEFFPVHPTLLMNKFSQSLNFHSYWDRINIVDYYVISKFGVQEMLLVVGTIGGLVSLFDSHFKEMHSKQLHQGAVNQFRFKQSEQFGKVLITTGDDLRINICIVENGCLKCVQMIAFSSPIVNLMLFKTYFYVTTKNQNQLEIYQINENDECIKSSINGDIKLEIKDQILNLGKKLIIVRNQIISCKLL